MAPRIQPLAEVFGFPIDNLSEAANRYRTKKLCPFNNKVPNCTKDKANDPLGVCSVYEADYTAITCPVRFRENWLIADDGADFFFPPGARWTSLTEVRLKDKYGKSAGNIDLVLVSYDRNGKVTDFGALEVQGVYISGNVRNPFEYYMKNPTNRANMNWKVVGYFEIEFFRKEPNARNGFSLDNPNESVENLERSDDQQWVAFWMDLEGIEPPESYLVRVPLRTNLGPVCERREWESNP